MKQKILDILAIQKKAVSYSYLKEELHIETKEDFTLFMKTINQCIDDLEIVETDQHELVLLEYSNLLKGILRINRKGFGFVDGGGGNGETTDVASGSLQCSREICRGIIYTEFGKVDVPRAVVVVRI